MATIAELHHHTRIAYYPAALEEPEVPNGAELLAVTVPDAASRHDPCDHLVEPHGGRILDLEDRYGWKGERAFFSMTPADKLGSDTIPQSPRNHSFHCLANDMQLITTGVGQTKLMFAAYTMVHLRSSRNQHLVIKRVTRHRDGGGKIETSESIHFVNLQDFLALTPQAQWMADIADLLEQRSDRAARHVRYREESHEITLSKPIFWKEPRRMQFAKALPGMATRITIEQANHDIKPGDEPAACAICQSPFDNTDTVPMAMRCHPNHTAYHSCVLQWAESQGPSTRCMHCRAPLLDENSMERLRLGLEPNDDRTYVADPRYTEFENFERSCAELDEAVGCGEPEYTILASPAFMLQIFDYFLDKMRQEPAGRTPLHLQMARRPEIGILRTAFEVTINDDKNRSLEALPELRDRTMRETSHRLHACHVGPQASMHCFLSEFEWEFVYDREFYKWVADVLPGFYEVAEKLLSRSLRFVQMRYCNCAGPVAGVHWHGMKAYYASAQ